MQWAALLRRGHLSDLVDQDWATHTYETLKRLIAVTRRELELLSFGQYSVLDWSTNDASSVTSQFGMIKAHPDDLESLADRCVPCLYAIMLHAFSMSDESGNSLWTSLITLAAALRDIGVEIDPDHLFGKFFVTLQSQPDEDDATTAT